jgi:hypothetical protein
MQYCCTVSASSERPASVARSTRAETGNRKLELRSWLRALACAGIALASASAGHAQEAAPASEAQVEPEPEAPAEGEPVYELGPLVYRPARGIQFGKSGLTIGGFATFEFDSPESEADEFALDGPNFLVLYEPIDKLRFFAELEVGDLFTWPPGDKVESDASATFERLYAEYSFSDAATIRLGKFQTPVGRWNLAPAEPFVWTPTQPVLLEVGLGEESQTGAAIFGSFYPGHRVVNYWVYGQFVDSFDLESDEDPPNRSVGGRVEYGDARGRWSFGASLLASAEHGAWSTLGGVDTKLLVGERLELSAEAVVSGGDIPDRDFWGVFVEAAYPLDQLSPKLAKLYAVGRIEHFDSSLERATQIGDVGLTWLPREWLVLKASYRFSTHELDQVSRGLLITTSVIW